MAEQYDNDNSGILFVNDRKETDRQPDYKGSVTVDGVDYWLAAWRKETRSGKAISLALTPKETTTAGRSREEPRGRGREDYDEPPRRSRSRDDDEPPRRARAPEVSRPHRESSIGFEDDVPF